MRETEKQRSRSISFISDFSTGSSTRDADEIPKREKVLIPVRAAPWGLVKG